MTATIETPRLAALARLLAYPDDALRADLADIAAILAPEAGISALVRDLATRDLYELQERYVSLFDRTRSLSLDLFEHVHGESRDRGQAMVDLAEQYAAAGLEASTHELPDYLPMFLEYAALHAPAEALKLLTDAAPIAAQSEARLTERASPYAAIFRALLDFAHAPVQAAGEPPPADDLAALDAEWAERPVEFGPGAAPDACGLEALKTKVRAARRDVRRLAPEGSLP